MYLCVYKLIVTYNKLTELKMESNFLNVQRMQYKSFQDHLDEIRIMRHDIRHHLRLISSCLENGDTGALQELIQEYTRTLDDEVTNVYCQNTTLNMVLNYYAQLCQKNYIDFDVTIGAEVYFQSILSENEIAVLFGNLLENAFDACLKQMSGMRKISVHAIRRKDIIVTIDNTFVNSISRDSQNRFLSTKHSGYGLGTISAQNIVQRHQGTILFEARKDKFCVSIMLPSKALT